MRRPPFRCGRISIAPQTDSPRGCLRLLQHWPYRTTIAPRIPSDRFLEGSLLPADEAHTYWNGTFSPSSKLIRLAAQRRLLQGTVRYTCPPPIITGSLKIVTWLRSTLLSDRRHPAEVESHEHGAFHSRCSRFLDHHRFGFAARLPEANMKINGHQHKLQLSA